MIPNNVNGMLSGFGWFVFFALEIIFIINMVIKNNISKKKSIEKELQKDKFHKLDNNI